MIFDLILSYFFGVLSFVLDLLPDFDAPSWMDYSEGGIAFTVGAFVYKLGAWVPVDAVGEFLQFAGLVVPLAATGGILLWVFSLVPGGPKT